MRLPARLRIKASRDFERLKQEGRSFPGRYLVLSVLPEPEAIPFKFGLITTRKVGGAVQRNTIRRRLREVIRAEQSRLKVGFLFIVIARWRSVDASLADLRTDWLKLATRADLLKPSDA